ncbi:uncharacterized protein BJ212DRAFT_1270875 [Suillus subaureus]|uniref:Uncharacterized protein n=1 Tax=Suillus subaureus TaxID=48587 RepID=A0A9P7JE70_9AGAM|nr:uncharacterized protein BJ212DRAFT_1270875 [Suillus subaureus]KAG1817271.1 hypothetical protein BJ212DRAFT_1270875 [Suillus subaureus]
MGSTLSHTSLEWAVAAGIAGAAAYSYLTYANTDTPTTTSEHPTTGRKGTKSKKKKQTPKATGISKPSEKSITTTTTSSITATSTTTATTATATSAHGNPVPEPTVVPFPHVIPGEFDAVLSSSEDQSVQVKTKKKKTKTKTKKQTEKQKEKQKVTGTTLDDASERQSSSLASQSSGDVPRTYIDMPSEVFSPKAEQELRTLQIRSSSPSFDTDSSWMRIDTRQRARGAKTATGSDNQILAITTDMTSSDVGPSTGDSVIAERTDEDGDASLDVGIPGDKRRTLAERLLPRHRKTAVDDMLERPDYPGLARVMRVQPRPDEAPAPGFSWKDYEDVDDSSGTLNDADGEGDGEWGIVKGKGRTKVSRPSTTPSQLVQQVPQALTKKQRQNAKRNQMLKDAKAEAEADRLTKLAEHRRALEREKIIDQSRRGGGKQTSGGMQATVDSRGKLVWD